MKGHQRSVYSICPFISAEASLPCLSRAHTWQKWYVVCFICSPALVTCAGYSQTASATKYISKDKEEKEKCLLKGLFKQLHRTFLLLRFELFFFFFTLCKYKVQNNLGTYSAVLYIHRQYSTFVIYCNLLLIITTNLLCEKHRPWHNNEYSGLGIVWI